MLCVFFFNDTATTEIYTLSLHDALPISGLWRRRGRRSRRGVALSLGRRRRPRARAARSARARRRDTGEARAAPGRVDRKSTRLNSSHANISYAVFCLKKKPIRPPPPPTY